MPRSPLTVPEPRRSLPSPPDNRRGRKGFTPSVVPPFTPTPEMPINPGEIISEEDQNRLMQADHIFTMTFFDIGDTALRYVEQAPCVRKDKRVVTIAHVYKSVGYFCRRQERTVRLYAETAQFFSPAVRAEYDCVPFSTFVMAKTFGGDWEQILQFAQDKPSASVDEIRYHFRQLKEQQREEGAERFHTAPQGEDVRECDVDAPEPSCGLAEASSEPVGEVVDVERGKRLVSFALSQLSSVVDALSSIARSDAITERAYLAVRKALEAVAEAIKVVREEMGKV